MAWHALPAGTAPQDVNTFEPAALKQFEAAVPLGRMATTADVVEIVTFLASDLSSNMTGSEIVTDGGLGL